MGEPLDSFPTPGIQAQISRRRIQAQSNYEKHDALASVVPVLSPSGSVQKRSELTTRPPSRLRFVVLDTETTGVHAACRMVQMAWQVYDDCGDLLEAHVHVVRPEGFEIPARVADVHGFSTKRARAEGRPVADVLAAFRATFDAYPGATYVAHNMRFDDRVLQTELQHAGQSAFLRAWLAAAKHCTYAAIPYVRGQSRALGAVYRAAFGRDLDCAHTADADATACAAIFFEARNIKIGGHRRGRRCST